MSNIKELIRQEIERRKEELERDKYINIDAKTCRQSELKYLERFIDSLPEETKDVEQAAARYERENRQSVLSSVDIVNAFIEGARWKEGRR